MRQKSTAVFIGSTLILSGVLDLLDSEEGHASSSRQKRMGLVKACIGVAAFAVMHSDDDTALYNRSVASGFVGMTVLGYLTKNDPSYQLMPIFAKQVADSLRS